MHEALYAEVDRRLSIAGLETEIADLVLTACLAPEELTDPVANREARVPMGVAELEPAAPPASTYLASVAVTGFRGIGATVTIPLSPGPGLTLIVGRNGTGKSSVSDALEVLLTGDCARRTAGKRTQPWKEGWRNLHHQSASIEANFVIEGVPGSTTISRVWTSDGAFDTQTTTVSRAGQPKTDLRALGWDDALAAYRPFLPYSELGGMIDDGPSKLFDALHAILGLEELTEAIKALADARLALQHDADQAEAARGRLTGMLEACEDPRAAQISTLLAKKTPNLSAVGAVLDADEAAPSPNDSIQILKELAALRPPDSDSLTAAAVGLADAAAAVDALRSTDTGRARHTAQLLSAALDFHAEHGDSDCPVCGRSGALTEAWKSSAEADRDRLRALAVDADSAHRALSEAITRARTLVRRPPDLLIHPTAPEEALQAHEAWMRWASDADELTPAALAEHLSKDVPFADDVILVASSAEELLSSMQADWRPVAAAVRAWVELAAGSALRDARIKDLKAAERWLKGAEDSIRSERFEPLAKAAENVWQDLRMRSSVDIGGVRLAGTATRRRVEIEVNVDGASAGALAVMSQGELHALALALFLPRATLPESPFRFLVIDDPVQAMDPAKVDGLAKVLQDTASDHQVVVLTHDDRLPEAVRRLDIDATVLEVSRGPQSAVTVTKCLDPVDRRIADARTVAKSDELHENVRQRVVPTLCRQALEAAGIEAVRRRRIGRGDPHAEVERVLHDAYKLYPLIALALFDDDQRTGDVLGRLGNWDARYPETFKACNKGAHEPHTGDLSDLVSVVGSLARKIRTSA